ncbi:MAG: hypothetical protein ABSE49_35450 [Polyangiaceae bacterium]|jgi:hypothetical protein
MMWSAGLAVLLVRLTLPLPEAVAPRAGCLAAFVAILGQLAIGSVALGPGRRWVLVPVAIAGQECIWALTLVAYLLAAGDPPANLPHDAGSIALVAGVFALPVGIAQAALAAIALRTSADPALDAVDRTVVGLCQRLATAGVIVAFVLLLLHLHDGAGLASEVIPWVAASVVLPALVAAATISLGRARLRWLRRVDHGLVPRWRVVAARPGSDDDVLAPVFAGQRQGASEATRVLVAIEPSQEPFRDVETVRPIALVPGRSGILHSPPPRGW